MAPEQQIAVKPLVVDTINLPRYGRALVTLRAPVTNTEHFYFTVPKTCMQVVLDSLEVHDTRGDKPRVSFPAPVVTNIQPLELKKTAAWKDLLTRHQGAHVGLHARSGPVDGYFLGFHRHQRYEKPWVVLLSDGNVCLHEIDSISAITFKGEQVAKKLERYTSTLCRIQEGDSVYRIGVTACGVGRGEVVVSYADPSPPSPTYDLSYTIHDEGDTDVSDVNKRADKGRTGNRRVRVRCYAVIRNPLHYDLNDVHFILHTGPYRYYERTDTYDKTVDEKEDDESESRSSSSSLSPRRRRRRRNRSPIRSRSPSPNRAPSPVIPARSKSPSHDSELDTLSDSSSDTGSISDCSTTSVNAGREGLLREWDLPGKICIREGESVKVLLYETEMEGGIVHLYQAGISVKRAVLLRNSTDKMFEPGLAMFFTKGLCVKLHLSHLEPGEDQYGYFRSSGCTVEKAYSSRRGEVLCSRIVNKKLVAKVMWYRKWRYLVFNKEDEEIDVVIDHEGGEKTGREVQTTARFYPVASRLGDEEDEDNGEELERYTKGYLHWVPYLIRVAAKQRCAVVVSETEEKVETYSILDCSKQSVARLEEMKVVSAGLAEKLRGLAEMKREMERLRRTWKLHRKRLDCVKRYEREVAQEEVSSGREDAESNEDGEDGNKRFFGAISAAEDSISEIEDALDKIEDEVVKLKGRTKDAKEAICGMKGMELCNATEENS